MGASGDGKCVQAIYKETQAQSKPGTALCIIFITNEKLQVQSNPISNHKILLLVERGGGGGMEEQKQLNAMFMLSLLKMRSFIQ